MSKTTIVTSNNYNFSEMCKMPDCSMDKMYVQVSSDSLVAHV
ncbi:MAG TPA: hypothetical protein VFP49_06860 [Nitrososphaeraceae archaeon]|nr:hypothetical protein [Nitrososphaeraceae archaeon]